MDNTLKITLFNRLILSANPQADLYEYYSIDSWGEQGLVETYTWINVDMAEPTQEELDAENLIYQDELLEREIHPLVSRLILRIDPSVIYFPTYILGDKYSEAKWSDDVINEDNQKRREEIQSRIDSLNEGKINRDERIAEIEAIPEGDRTDQEAEELQILTTQVIGIVSDISELQNQYDNITDVEQGPRPTWEQIKTEYQAYLAEVQAQKEAEDQEENELKSISLYEVFASLVGPDVVFYYEGRLLYKNIIVKNGEKPTLQEVRDEWAIIQPILQEKRVRQQKKSVGNSIRNICLSIETLMIGNNLEKGLTIEQINQMETDYADIFTALKNNRPDKTKALLVALEPDGVLFTQEDKDEYLAEFASFGM